MKKAIKTAFLTAFGLLGAGCAHEEMIMGGEQGVPVEIRIDTRSGGEGTHPGSVDDRKVASLRVLIYDRHGVLKWNFSSPVDLSVASLSSGAAAAEQLNELSILTGTYDFVFVANEGDLADKLAALAPGSSMSTLRAMSFDEAAFNEQDLIPMVSLYTGVQVIADKSVKYPDPFNGGAEKTQLTDGGDPEAWNVLLERAGIRLRLAITLTESQYAAWSDKKIWIDSIPAGAFLLPGIANSAAPWEEDRPYAAAVAAGAPGTITGPADGKYTVTYDRIILPEVLFSPAGDPGKALELSMTLGDKPKRGKIWVGTAYTDGWGYTLPRNTFLEMTVSIEDDGIVFSGITVIDWGGKHTYNLTDRGIVLPTSGFPAPPGVLGVNARTGQLTLRGSVHYKGTPVATDPASNGEATLEFGPISNDSVYVAYFKWGSLIGLSSDTEQKSYKEFEKRDIVWVPKNYDLGALYRDIDAEETEKGKWDQIPYADDGVWPSAARPSAGLGDPCTLAEVGKGTAKVRYMTPVGNTWNRMAEEEFGEWTSVDVGGTTVYGRYYEHSGGTTVNGRYEHSSFLPAAGERDDYGGLYDQNNYGRYRSSSLSNLTNIVYGMYLNSSNFGIREPGYLSTGNAIRCVKQKTFIAEISENEEPAPGEPLPVGGHHELTYIGYVFYHPAGSYKYVDSVDIKVEIEQSHKQWYPMVKVYDRNLNHHYQQRGTLYKELSREESASLFSGLADGLGTGSQTVTFTPPVIQASMIYSIVFMENEDPGEGIDPFSNPVRVFWCWGGEDHLLYFDDENRLALGRWGKTADMTTNNLALFKFGSVVGVSSTGNWSSSCSNAQPVG